MEKQYVYNQIENLANYLTERVSIKPLVGIICGSGLGSVGETLRNTITFDYKDIPNFPISTVIGHAGRLLFGDIKDTPVICMQGRFHFYEGNSLSACTMPIRLMALLGVKILIVSNAAGSVNPLYKVGDIMFIKDQINFVGMAGFNPLRGPNEHRFGPRFQLLDSSYDPRFISEAKNVAKKLGMKGIQEGVYACVGGPNYETVAEIRMLRVLGADAVGMSTVHEVITARHCGIKCFGFSLITNECVADYDAENYPDAEEVIAVAEENETRMKRFAEELVPVLAQQEINK